MIYLKGNTMQTYKDKIEWLLKFCADYDGHEFMYDEHISDAEKFHIKMNIESRIEKYMDRKHIIILTGDAGDGKSRIINNMKLCKRYKEWTYINDFSELNRNEKEILLDKLNSIFEENSDDRFLIAANSGILMSEVILYKHGLLTKLKESDTCVIIDFSKRNLAENEDEFKQIITNFLKCTDCKECKKCKIRCPFIYNLKELTESSEKGIKRREQLRMVYYALYLKGVHITFRDFLSSLAYAVTGGRTCEELQKENRLIDGNFEYLYYYNNLFDYKDGGNAFLKEMRKIDPGTQNHKVDRKLYLNEIGSEMGNETPIEKRKSRFQYVIREKYFNTPSELLDINKKMFSLLNMEYLEEYWTVIEKLKKDGILDAEDKEHSILWKFELGINRIFNPERSDAQLVLFDAPLIVDPKVRIEHEVGDETELCFCTQQYYDDICREKKIKKGEIGNMNNFLCVSITEAVNDSMPYFEKLLVNYELFRQIMMAAEGRYDTEILNMAGDTRIKNFIANTFQHTSINEKIKVQWLGDAKMKYSTFELYTSYQKGIRGWKKGASTKKTYRIGKG